MFFSLFLLKSKEKGGLKTKVKLNKEKSICSICMGSAIIKGGKVQWMRRMKKVII